MREFRVKGGWWVVGQGLMFAGVAAALWRGGSDEAPIGLVWLGALVAATGLALAGDALLRIRKHITALPAPAPGAPLVEEGSFSLVRHPIYGGLVVSALGIAAARASAIGVAAVCALGVFFFLKARFEERLLAAAFPGYDAYRARVRRSLIPWVV